jgi:hypothetical protein
MGAANVMEILAARARLRPATRIVFPAEAAVAIRGALGFVLPEEYFRPRRTGGPSGLRDAPRPFVLRVRHLDGRVVEGGESFDIGVNLFAPGLAGVFEMALRRMGEMGIGRGRVKLEWEGWEAVTRSCDLGAKEECKSVWVRFLTPTELKGWEGEGRPPFEVLAARARDRVSALQAMYGGGEPELDFRGLGARARGVQAVEGQIEWVRGQRRSSRTGQCHPLGGFRGKMRYQGDLGEFMPLLRAACWTGVGRQTVWGHGQLGLV